MSSYRQCPYTCGRCQSAQAQKLLRRRDKVHLGERSKVSYHKVKSALTCLHNKENGTRVLENLF